MAEDKDLDGGKKLKIKTGEAGKPEIAFGEETYLKPEQSKDSRDDSTIYGQINALTVEIKKKAQDKTPLGDEELAKPLELIDQLPGGKKTRKSLLGGAVAQMAASVSTEEKYNNQRNSWDELTQDIKVEENREKFPEVALIYDFIKIHGGDPAGVSWETMVAFGKAISRVNEGGVVPDKLLEQIAGTAKNKGKFLDTLKEVFGKKKQGAKKPLNKEGLEVALSAILAGREGEVRVDAAEFFKERLLLAVEARLDGMRGELAWTETDKNDPDKLAWVKGAFEEGRAFSKGLRTSLFAYDEYDDYFIGTGSVAVFLSERGVVDFWEGKRTLDKACWAKALGFVEGETNDIYAEIDKEKIMESGIEALAGPEAVGKWSIDKGFRDVFDILFASVEPVYDKDRDEWYYKPPTLKDSIARARELGYSQRQIEDAIMANIVFATDLVKNAWAKNRLYIGQRFADYYKITKYIDERGQAHDIFGDGFGLTDSLTGKMGRESPRNLMIDYAADTNDPRRLDLDKNPDQRDGVWMSVYWYKAVGLRGIYGGRHDPKKLEDASGNPVDEFHPEDIVLPGNVGDFLDYNNDLTREINGERVFIHRQALYRCLLQVAKQHHEARKNGFPGKPGYEQKFGSELTLDQEVVQILTHFRSKREIDVFADGKIGEEEVSKKLQRILRNPYTWGIMFSFNDGETFSRMRQGFTIRRGLEYEHKTAKAVAVFRDQAKFGLYPDQLPEQLNITPKAVFDMLQATMGSRYAYSQLTRQAEPLFGYARNIAMQQLAKSMPDQQRVDQAYADEGGGLNIWSGQEFVRSLINLGNKYTVERAKTLNTMDEYVNDMFGPRTILGQDLLVNARFIYMFTLGALDKISSGDQASADAAALAFILKERDSRAFTWQRARQVIWQARGFFWSFVGTLPKLGVEGSPASMPQWQHLDIVREGGDLKLTTIGIQDITDAEMELYFDVIDPGAPEETRINELYKSLNIEKNLSPESYTLESELKLLVFKNPEARLRFYMNRTTQVMNLFYGREGSYKITLDPKLYKADGGKPAGDGDLIRQAGNIYEYAFAVERANAYIEAEKIYLHGMMDGKPIVEIREKVEQLLRTLQGNEQLRERDIERIEAQLGGWDDFFTSARSTRTQLVRGIFKTPMKDIKFLGIGNLLGVLPIIKNMTIAQTAVGSFVVWALPIMTRGALSSESTALFGQFLAKKALGNFLGGLAGTPLGYIMWYGAGFGALGKWISGGLELLLNKRLLGVTARPVPGSLYDIDEEVPFTPKN